MAKRKHIELTSEEDAELERYDTKGVRSIRLLNRTKITLALTRPTAEKRKSKPPRRVPTQLKLQLCRTHYLAGFQAEALRKFL